jgi:hypothetical protein
MDAMLPDNWTTNSCPQLAHLSEHTICGPKHIMHVVQSMKTDTLPDEQKPLGEALAKSRVQALNSTYPQCLKPISDLGLQQIAPVAITS